MATSSAAETEAAPDLLRKLDANDDELVGPGELVASIAYPGTGGAILLCPARARRSEVPEVAALPVLLLPARRSDRQWTNNVIARQDTDGDGKLNRQEFALAEDVFSRLDQNGDGRLSAAELAHWRRQPADMTWHVHAGRRPDAQRALDGSTSVSSDERSNEPALRFDVRFDEGRLPTIVAEVVKRFEDHFVEADANTDGLVDAKETGQSNFEDLKQLIQIADLDGDDCLSRPELASWLAFEKQVARGHVLLTILDFGPGLFELLDANHDGSLSVRELRTTADRLQAAGCLADGHLKAASLPRQLTATVSLGRPTSSLGEHERHGPEWFTAMDRNLDGDVSRREFLGPIDAFGRLDADRDDLIGPAEATALRPEANTAAAATATADE